MKIRKEARLILVEAAQKKRGEHVPVFTKQEIKRLMNTNTLLVDFYGTPENTQELIEKALIIKKETGYTTPIILNHTLYQDINTQNQINKSETNYHKINSGANLKKIIELTLDYYKNKNQPKKKELEQNPTIKTFMTQDNPKPTIDLMKTLKITPKKQALRIGKTIKTEKPKQGYAFNTFESDVIAVSWINLYIARILLEKKILEINLEKEDKNLYVGGFDATVKNKKTKKTYIVSYDRAILKNPGTEDYYRNAWTPKFFSTSKDFKMKGRTEKQKKDFLFAAKHIIAALDYVQKYIIEELKQKTGGAYKTLNNIFLEPNQEFMDLAEIVDTMLIVKKNPENISLLKASQTIQNQCLDMMIQKNTAQFYFKN